MKMGPDAVAFAQPTMPYWHRRQALIRSKTLGILPACAANSYLISDLLDAVDKNDSRRAEQPIPSLIMDNGDPWFAPGCSAQTLKLVRAAYKQSMKDFVRTTRELYASDIRRGSINIGVNRYDDLILQRVDDCRRVTTERTPALL